MRPGGLAADFTPRERSIDIVASRNEGLAPIAPAPRYSAAQAPETRGAGFGPARVSASLPPQAYRGPSVVQASGAPSSAASPLSASGQSLYLAPQ